MNSRYSGRSKGGLYTSPPQYEQQCEREAEQQHPHSQPPGDPALARPAECAAVRNRWSDPIFCAYFCWPACCPVAAAANHTPEGAPALPRRAPCRRSYSRTWGRYGAGRRRARTAPDRSVGIAGGRQALEATAVAGSPAASCSRSISAKTPHDVLGRRPTADRLPVYRGAGERSR